MKVLILAGGYATRLWPITKDRAKPLLPLGGKAILSYILDEIEDLQQIDGIYVTTNERYKDRFEEYISRREKKGKYELVIESQESEEEKYGAIGGMINVIENKNPDDYLIIGGDNYYSFDMNDFLGFSLEKGSVANACFQVESLEEAKNYGIVDFDEDHRIRSFQEKPEEPKSKMASTACYFFPEERLEAFDEYVDYWEGKIPRDEYLDEPGRFIEWIVKRYDTYAFPFQGKWVDIGTREGYLRAERKIGGGNKILGEVDSSEIGENVTILRGSRVKSCKIENSIVFEGCEIENCIIKNSLVGDNTGLKNKDLREGLVKDIELPKSE